MIPGFDRITAWWHQREREQRFRNEFARLAGMGTSTRSRFTMRWEDVKPCFGDDTAATGFDRHYVYHPAWAARIIKRIAPAEHIDISSSLHFCSMLSAFIPVRFYDYRPADLRLSDLSSAAADLMRLPFANNSVPSLSCMHTVEHVGLGRYGDPLDYDGDLKAIAELKRVVSPGGHLLFVAPTGKPRLIFNAHRIYAYEQVVDAFSGFELKEFALVPDDPVDGGLVQNASRELADRQNYGCGCYWFIKRNAT